MWSKTARSTRAYNTVNKWNKLLTLHVLFNLIYIWPNLLLSVPYPVGTVGSHPDFGIWLGHWLIRVRIDPNPDSVGQNLYFMDVDSGPDSNETTLYWVNWPGFRVIDRTIWGQNYRWLSLSEFIIKGPKCRVQKSPNKTHDFKVHKKLGWVPGNSDPYQNCLKLVWGCIIIDTGLHYGFILRMIIKQYTVMRKKSCKNV